LVLDAKNGVRKHIYGASSYGDKTILKRKPFPGTVIQGVILALVIINSQL